MLSTILAVISACVLLYEFCKMMAELRSWVRKKLRARRTKHIE